MVAGQLITFIGIRSFDSSSCQSAGYLESCSLAGLHFISGNIWYCLRKIMSEAIMLILAVANFVLQPLCQREAAADKKI